MTNILNSIVEYKVRLLKLEKNKTILSRQRAVAEQTHIRGFVQALEAQLTKSNRLS